jgi:hypothetical protein
MQVNPVHALLSLLRQHAQAMPPNASKDSVPGGPAGNPVTTLETELGLRLLNRILAKEAAALAASRAVFNHLEAEGPIPRASISAQSVDTLNNLAPVSHARRWEAEALLQLIGGGTAAASTGPAKGLAQPFKPSADDIDQAVEFLAQMRNLSVESATWRRLDDAERPSAQRFAVRLLVPAIGIAIFLLVIASL